MRFQSKPIMVDAIPARSLLNRRWEDPSIPYWAIIAKRDQKLTVVEEKNTVVVKTLRGNKTAKVSDWILNDPNGELTVLSHEKLLELYEEVTG